jgi:hypothetical protein
MRMESRTNGGLIQKNRDRKMGEDMGILVRAIGI